MDVTHILSDVTAIFTLDVIKWIVVGEVVAVGLLHLFFDIASMIRSSKWGRAWVVFVMWAICAQMVLILFLKS
jgi:hypothetical protein